MSKLSPFVGATKEIEVEGRKLTIHPLRTRHSDIMDDIRTGNKSEKKAASLKLYRTVLGDDTITQEDVDNLPLAIENAVIEAVIEVNGIKSRIDNVKTQLTPKS